mgnify:CR=1 FL=1
MLVDMLWFRFECSIGRPRGDEIGDALISDDPKKIISVAFAWPACWTVGIGTFLSILHCVLFNIYFYLIFSKFWAALCVTDGLRDLLLNSVDEYLAYPLPRCLMLEILLNFSTIVMFSLLLSCELYFSPRCGSLSFCSTLTIWSDP